MAQPRGLSSNTMNLKFMQRKNPPAPTGQPSNNSDQPADTQDVKPPHHTASRSSTAADPFPIPSTSSSTGHPGDTQKGKRKIIIEPGYAPFPCLLKHATFSPKELSTTAAKSEESSGRQTFGQPAFRSSKAKGKAKSEREDSDEDDDSMPSSSDDEVKPPTSSKAAPSRAVQQQPSHKKPSAVPGPSRGFQEPSGLEGLKPAKVKKEAEDSFVDDMIQGARAKRIKRVKREPASSPDKTKTKKKATP